MANSISISIYSQNQTIGASLPNLQEYLKNKNKHSLILFQRLPGRVLGVSNRKGMGVEGGFFYQNESSY